jgi:methyl-accepting chemotaxis protein
MARQASEGRRISPGRYPSSGAAVLDRPVADARETKRKDLLQEEILRVGSALQQGRLAERARAELFNGGDHAIMESLNGMLDAVIKPLNVSAEYVERISKGDIPPKITDAYNGDFNEIKNNLNACIDALNGLLNASAEMYRAQKAGDIDAFITVEQFQGAYREMAKDVNEAARLHINVVQKLLEVMGAYSEGDFSIVLDRLPGKQAVANQKTDLLRGNVTAMIAETASLAQAAVAGRLATRADGSKFSGDFRKIVEGFNETLDAVIKPLNVSAEYMDRISKGEIPPKITDVYNGDFNEIKNNLNNCIDGLGGLVESNAALKLMAVNDYSRRVKGEYAGVYAEVAQATNLVQDRISHVTSIIKSVSQGDLSPLAELKTAGRRSERDELVPAFILLMENLKALVADSVGLAQTMQEGKLAARADAAKHQGDYRKVIEGFNQTLDNIIKPLNISAEYMDRISKGEIPPKITETCNGDFNEIKNNLNVLLDWLTSLVAYLTKVANGDMTASMAQASDKDQICEWLMLLKNNVNALMADAGLLAKAAVEGKLAIRADASKHQGGYRKIIEGVNNTLDAVIGPLNMAAEYVDRISKGDIPPKITDTYNGDFNEIKNNLNACIDGLGGLVEANTILQNMAVNDYTKAVEGHYAGIFAEVATAVNATQDRVEHVILAIQNIAKGDLKDLPEFKKLGHRSEHDRVMPTIIMLMENLEALVKDTGLLAQAAADGRVGTRADVSKHHGEYRKIVDGINKTLDEVVEPLKAAAQSATTLASSSEELSAVSHQMAGNAEETATQASVVSAASEQVSRNVSSVASASEQMQASIREIAKHANEAARVAKNAVSVAHSTNETVRKLGESSQEIGNVIKVITSIAQQTNLLALNATIEAARAGEAGKGFAVVANEVKELAKQTAKATEEIGRKIEAIQGDTKGAVTAIEEIGSIINQINDVSNSIASAVEEQTVTTSEIGRSVTEAAKGVGDIAKNIGGVAVAAKDTTQGANDTQKAAIELSQMAARLQTVIAKFTF